MRNDALDVTAATTGQCRLATVVISRRPSVRRIRLAPEALRSARPSPAEQFRPDAAAHPGTEQVSACSSGSRGAEAVQQIAELDHGDTDGGVADAVGQHHGVAVEEGPAGVEDVGNVPLSL